MRKMYIYEQISRVMSSLFVTVSTAHGYNLKYVIFIEKKWLYFSIVGKQLASVLTGLWRVDIVDIWPYQLWLSG